MLALMTALNYDHHQQLHFVMNHYAMQQSINLHLPCSLGVKRNCWVPETTWHLSPLPAPPLHQGDVVTTGTLHVLLKHRLWHECC